MALTSDPRSKVLLAATGLGQTLLLRPKMEDDWEVVRDLDVGANIDPVTCADVLNLG